MAKPYPRLQKRLGKRLARDGRLRRGRRLQANEGRSKRSECALLLAHGGPQKSLLPENLLASPQRKLVEAPQPEELLDGGHPDLPSADVKSASSGTVTKGRRLRPGVLSSAWVRGPAPKPPNNWASIRRLWPALFGGSHDANDPLPNFASAPGDFVACCQSGRQGLQHHSSGWSEGTWRHKHQRRMLQLLLLQ